MASIPPDITETLPVLLSARTVSAAGEAKGVLYDFVIAGIGLVSAIDSQNPYIRETVAVQKQQIDTSTEAGEQTLDGAWIRSQTSWHLGAGADYYEPGNRDETTPSRFRFKDSRGINPWTRGQLSLHRAMEAVTTSTGGVAVCGARLGGEDVWFSYDLDGVYRHDSLGDHLLSTPDFASPLQGIVNAGSALLIGGAFGIKTVDPSTGAHAALLSRAIGPVCRPYWVKGRILTTTGTEVHQHALTGGAIDATSLLFDHPDDDWTWTGVAETPDAILAAGHAGGVSSIFAFVLSEGSTTVAPELTQPAVVAELPPGEEIRSIRSYLGKYLGIGTTAGLRVGVIGQRGEVQYGPLLVETAAPVVDLGARDSFLYAATGSSIIRVNLDEPIDEGLRFPYAYDVEIPSGTITSLAFDGVTDRVVVGVDTVGTFAASETEYVPSGWIESGQVRYGTTAPKAFRTIDVESTTPGTTRVAISAVVAGTEQTIITLAKGMLGRGVSLGNLPSPLAQAGYRLLLSGGTQTPVVEAVALKAIPTPTRQRLVQFPAMCVDRPRDSKGVPYGKEGFASELLQSLEALENSGSTVSVVDRTRPEQFEATIEKVEFSRVEGRRGGAANFGGIVKVTVRTL